MQLKNQEVVRLGELQKQLGLDPTQERKLLQRLTNNGYLFRLQRGIYLVPTKIPAGGYWRPNEYYIIDKFMQIHDATYYISGLAAFNYHGLSEQIANQYLVYNNKLSALKKFGDLTVRFIKINKNRINGTNEITLPNKQKAHIASLARTILDAINDWKRFGKLEDAFKWVEDRKDNKKFVSDFILLTEQYANNSSKRRIGYILEKLGISERKLLPLSRKLKSIQSWIPLFPDLAARGITNKKWRIIDNAK